MNNDNQINEIASADPPLDTASMTSRAYRRMKQDIISGRLEPGSKLKIEELRKTLFEQAFKDDRK